MPTYKNLYIDGKAVNLVNGSSLKNIVIDDVVYEPEIGGYKYQHKIRLYINRMDYQGGSGQYGNGRYRTIDCYLIVLDNNSDKYTNVTGIPIGNYEIYSTITDGINSGSKLFLINNESNGYRYETSYTANASYYHPFTKITTFDINSENMLKINDKGTRSYIHPSAPYPSGSWQEYFGFTTTPPSSNSGSQYYSITDTITEI